MGPVFGRGHEPCGRIARDAGRGPLLEGRYERIVREIFGHADVADDAGETGDDLRRLHLPDRLDGALGYGSRHGYRSHHLQIWICKAVRSVRLQADQVRLEPDTTVSR